jgi:unsaturated rhamnogalacturonyl hydrolase
MQGIRLGWTAKTAEMLLKNQPSLFDSWDCRNGYALKAMFRMWERTGDKQYFNYCKRYIDGYINTDGTVQFGNFEDTINAELLFKLYDKTKSEKYRKASAFIFERVKEKNDFRVLPFCAGYISRFSKIKNYDIVVKKFLTAYKFSKDKRTGLIKSNGIASGIYTARFIEALSSVIEYMPYNCYERKYLIGILKNLVDSVIKFQDKSGCWRLVIDKPERQGNYIESLSSIMILYAILRSRLGYREETMRAYNGIADEFIMLSETGFTIIKSCSPDRPLTNYNSYIASPILSGQINTMGAFLLMLTEYEKN